MNNGQSIIVYRNPMEKALWEGEYAHILVPAFFAIVAFGITAFIGIRIVERMNVGYKRRIQLHTFALFVAMVIGAITLYKTV